jgi:hypothetical protein
MPPLAAHLAETRSGRIASGYDRGSASAKSRHTFTKEFSMLSLVEALNKEVAGDEATIVLTNGDSFRVKGDVESVSDTFISVALSNNPDKKGKKLVNVNHIVSISWYTK